MKKENNDQIYKKLLLTKKVALVVIDKQHGYLDSTGPLIKLLQTDTSDLQAKLPKIDDFIKQARKLGLEIIWTKMIENQQESPPNLALVGNLNISESGHKSFEIVGEQPLENELVIIKYHFDAFTNTQLNEYLRKHGISTLILIGAYASRCVLATSFAASGLGYNIIVVQNLIGNPDALSDEEKAALSIIRHVLGFVLDSDDVIKYLKKTD